MDLKVIAEKLKVLDSDPNGVLTLEDEQLLLDHCRALRTVLALPIYRERNPMLPNCTPLDGEVLWFWADKIDAVLSQVSDGEAAP